ncbi:MAG: hypothetical protein HC835_00840 [Oscillatoriales cyanobacterium RM2_1_1]|nr:hypothetical protein [Oscillatoriales cyanobacterium RM2_1_1]
MQQIVALAPDQPQYRILVVDEVSENRLLIVRLLKPLGFEVFEAEDGLAAMMECDRTPPI